LKCKYCKSIIEDGSLFCRFCGAQLFKAQKQETPIPKPKHLSNGRWTAQMMVNGKRCSIYGATFEQYEINARAIKAQLISAKNEPPRLTLGTAIDRYIASIANVLSPSTIRGYNYIRRGRFAGYMDKLIGDINWQQMVSDEAKKFAPHTVKNAWGLVSVSLSAAGEPIPNIHLPKSVKKELPFLDYKQIQVFLEAVKGNPIEPAAILALHSLRRSELAALTVDDISGGYIHVNKASVMNDGNVFVNKPTTKTEASTRDIPIMIPRLLEITPKSGKLVTIPETSLRDRINRICAANGLPLVGCHGLRRSFASLCYHLGWSERMVMQIGGWSTLQTVHDFYIKLYDSDKDQNVKAMKDFYKFTTE